MSNTTRLEENCGKVLTTDSVHNIKWLIVKTKPGNYTLYQNYHDMGYEPYIYDVKDDGEINWNLYKYNNQPLYPEDTIKENIKPGTVIHNKKNDDKYLVVTAYKDMIAIIKLANHSCVLIDGYIQYTQREVYNYFFVDRKGQYEIQG